MSSPRQQTNCLITDPANKSQVAGGPVPIHPCARGEAIANVTLWDASAWPDGSYELTVSAESADRKTAADRVTVCVSQDGSYTGLVRHAVDNENTLGEWRDKHILDTQLGPNENGRHWPSRRERERLER